MKETEIGYLWLVGVCVFQRTYVHIRKGSGSLTMTTQLKTDEKVDRARSGAQSIFNLDQQLTFSRTILLQAFPQHIGMSRTCIQFQDCIEIVFDTATRLWFHKDPRNLAHWHLHSCLLWKSLGNCVLIEIRRNVGGGIRTMWNADLSLTLCLHRGIFCWNRKKI